MRRLYPLLSLLVAMTPIVFVFFFGCAKVPDYWSEAKPGQKKVLVSFPPLYCIAHAVAGDDAYVLCLTTDGVHEHEKTLSDLHKLNKADLYIYNGLTLDNDFSDKLLRNRSNKTLATLEVGAVLENKDASLAEEDKVIRHGKIKHGNHYHNDDPHFWLSPKAAMHVPEIIAAKLAEVDPDHAGGYQKRAAGFVKELQELQNHGEAAFKDKKNRQFITMHDSFKYFAKAFKLDNDKSVQDFPGEDPDAGRLAELVREIKAKDIRIIAGEPQFAIVVPQAIQRSLKRDGFALAIIELDPLETAPVPNGRVNPDPRYYFDKMRANIDTLAKALP